MLSLFPGYFESPLAVSMLGRAQAKGLVEVGLVDIRDFSDRRHKQVDDRPYGGGPGMVLMAEPLLCAIRSVKRPSSLVIYLSPQGRPLNAERCAQLARDEAHLVLVCGHYEGIDERVMELEEGEKVSIGDYVLTSGAPAAMVLIDAVSRFIPGVLGNEEAVKQDSFEGGEFDAPVYTRPLVVEGMEVPPVLCQGNHARIADWRQKMARRNRQRVRPDLEVKEGGRPRVE